MIKDKRHMLVAVTLLVFTVCVMTGLAAATPSISSVLPNAGPLSGMNQVTITGAGFTGADIVDFGPTAGTNIQVANDNSLTVKVPAGSQYGTVDVRVHTPSGGWSLTSYADKYSYVPIATITSISPTEGDYRGGTHVTITGSYFTGADSVQFGAGNLGTNLVVVDDNEITVDSPAGNLGDIIYLQVHTPAGWSQVPWVTSVYTFGTAPSVTSITPKTGSVDGGNKVIIRGNYFTGASEVDFGSAKATDVHVDNDNQITVTAPAGTGAVDVRVITPLGTSAIVPTDVYTYVQVPYITSITPVTGPYAGGNQIDILGYGFTGVSKVVVGGHVANVLSNTDNKISIAAPQLTTQPGAPKTVDIQVTATGGVSTNSSRDQYTYVATPTIYSMSPTKGPTNGGTVVSITGVGFTGVSKVTFGAYDATAFTFVDDSHITATTPQEGAGTVNVVITSTGGISAASTSYNKYTFAPIPIVNSIAPNAGPSTGGTKVTITGVNLYEVTKVMFGANAATAVSVVDDSHITAKSPAGTGTVDVTVVSPSGTSATSDNDKFTYQQVAPSVTGVSPASGAAAGGNQVIVSGVGFTGATAIKFGSVAADMSTATITDAQITVKAPAGTGTVDITVTTPIGTSPINSNDKYQYVAPVVVTPTITSVSPTSGNGAGGNTVSIYGSGFTGATDVKFGGVSGSNLAVVSDTKLTVTAPAGSGTVDIVVVTASATSPLTAKDRYTYNAVPAPMPPKVTSVSPSSGNRRGGNSVSINGANLAGVTDVMFGSNPATDIRVISNSKVVARAPAGSRGTVHVTVTNSVGTSATSSRDRYTYR